MSNENYLNHYIEILTGTMSDAIIRNVSLQAQAKVNENVINELSKELDNVSTNKIAELEKVIKNYAETIADQQKQLNELNVIRAEFDNIKHQANHVDTFRNELIKEREEHLKTRDEYENKIKELNFKIEYLQLTPAKRKKIDEANTPKEVFVTGLQVVEGPISQLLEEPIKDGGNF